MSKKENEAVVNRFLLSTLYVILVEFGIYTLYKMSTTTPYVMWLSQVLYVLMGVFGVCFIASIVRQVAFKKDTVYYIVFTASLEVILLFLKFYPKVQMFYFTYRRFAVVAILAGLVYLYELIRYLIKNK